jgi:hypothetical protein
MIQQHLSTSIEIAINDALSILQRVATYDQAHICAHLA